MLKYISLLLAAAIAATPVSAGESSAQAQPYEKIRYPTFSEGRLHTMLEADQAEAYDLTEGTPRINLLNVVITIYDNSPETLARIPDDQPLPPRMIITSDRGFFTRRIPEPDRPPEEIANLEGNVVMRQMRLGDTPPKPTSRKRRLDPAIETEIHCQHAQWNNTMRKLNGDGEVEFIQEDSRIVGTGFLYLADDDSLDSKTSTSDIKNWGGIIFIEHNARMEIDRQSAPGIYDRTVITCEDTASYKLREREIQFERDVKVRRVDLLIESDILKVYLYREDDPDAPEAAGSEAVPGQVRSIVATIGKRPGSVIITGYEKGPNGEDVVKYKSRGGRADMDYLSNIGNHIVVTDSRPERMPEVEFDQGRFSDRVLDFYFTSGPTGEVGDSGDSGETVLERLTTTGGQGQVLLRPQPAPGSNLPGPSTEVSYKKDMLYNRSENKIRFTGSVFLKRGDFRIRSEILEIRLTPGRQDKDLVQNQFEKIIAETDVNILSEGREARAQRAEYDVVYYEELGYNLDTLKLYGPPERTPPHPWLRDESGNQTTAPVIVLQRLQTGPGERPRHLLTGSGGVAIADFFTDPGNLVDRGKVISIKCENGMEYNEATQIATFHGQVQAASDAPEDNYVMTSDRLDIRFVETPDPDSPNDRLVLLRRIHAIGNAVFMQDNRVCDANQIIRDFPTVQLNEGDIYLEGIPAQAGRQAVPAVYREQIGREIGTMFAAPRIMATASGDIIRANGPGQLSTPDDIPGFRSEINFDGAALYESFKEGAVSEAKFRQNVILRQPSRNLVINCEELDTRFLNEEDETPDDASIGQVGKLRRAEARVAVKLESSLPRQGRRFATGDKCVVDFTSLGNTVTMTVDRQQDNRRWVFVRDHDGLTLRAPQVEVRDQQGITRASGPGELLLPGNRAPATGGEGRAPTRVLYGENGRMVYNELALNIRVNDNVRIVQPGINDNWSYPSLDGRCDDLEIILLEPPAQSMDQEETMARMDRMDANGAVVLRVYADPPPENPNIDWLSRPGTTFFTRGDRSIYEIREGRIAISSNPGKQPQLLLNIVEAGKAPRRQRLKADRFILDTNSMPRKWFFEGQMESSALREGDPFDFVN